MIESKKLKGWKPNITQLGASPRESNTEIIPAGWKSAREITLSEREVRISGHKDVANRNESISV